MNSVLWLAACAPAPRELAEFSGEINWMRPGVTGVLWMDVVADPPGLSVFRVQDLAADGTFSFTDLPVGEAWLRGEILAEDAADCDLYTDPRALGPEGIHLVFDWCGGYD